MSTTPSSADGIAVLSAFHGRIRAALDELAALSTSALPAPERRERATALLAFLRGPFVWHDLDEEVCLAPLLMTKTWSDDIERMIAAMSASHAGMEAQLEPLAAVLGDAAAGSDVDRGVLRARVSSFIAYVEMSLAGEERLFQRVRAALGDDERALLAAHIAGCEAARPGALDQGPPRR